MKDETFGRDYFDCGKDETGKYREYTFASKYPYFESLAATLTDTLQPHRVLDLGCAKGLLVLAFRKLGIESYGIDVSDYALGEAPEDVRKYLIRLDLNLEKLPFDNQSFELITALGVLKYIEDLPNLLREIRRLLTDNGVLFVREVYPEIWPARTLARLTDARRLGIQRTRTSWLKALEGHGFEFMEQMTRETYPTNLNDWLLYSLRSGRSAKYAFGRYLYKRSKFGRAILAEYARSRVGFLYLKPSSNRLPRLTSTTYFSDQELSKPVDSSKHWDELGTENIDDADTMPPGLNLRKGKHLSGHPQFQQHSFYLADRKRVLDVPCGYGRYLIPISKDHDAVGVDLSQSLLRRCKQNIIENKVRTALVRADIRYLPFRNDTFDVVLCLNSLYYVEPKRWSVIFTEVSNLLSKDGEFELNMQMRSEVWAAHNGFGSFVVLARIVYELEKRAWFRRLWGQFGFRTFHGLYTFHTTRNTLVMMLTRAKMQCVKITDEKRPLFVCTKQNGVLL